AAVVEPADDDAALGGAVAAVHHGVGLDDAGAARLLDQGRVGERVHPALQRWPPGPLPAARRGRGGVEAEGVLAHRPAERVAEAETVAVGAELAQERRDRMRRVVVAGPAEPRQPAGGGE